MELSLTRRDVDGRMESAAGFTGRGDSQGVLLRTPVELPAFQCCTYYAAYQKYDCVNPQTDHGHNGANRIQPLKIDHFDDLKPWGVFLLAQLADGDVLAVLPVSGPASAAWFEGLDGRLTLTVGTGGTEAVEADLPLLAWARSADAYDACRRVWQIAMDSPFVAGATRPRCQKAYPEPFRYLGWCSWEQFRADIDEGILTDCIGRIEAGDAPVRYVLVDDGHFAQSAPDDRRLMSFVPDAEKFPNGWGPVVGAAGPKVRWVGLWLNFNGYWMGIHPDNRLGEVNEHLTAVSDRTLQPRNDAASSLAFHDAMVSAARRAGFAFVKVDHQAANFELYRGTANAAASAARNAQSLEAACAHHMDGLINCMAHGPACLFNTRCSAVTRCSEDYRMGDLGRARRHLHNSFANIPWLGQTVWGDHDMFHSSDPVAGRMMAVSKALAGGPVYLSDSPEEFDLEHIRPLCYDDGLLLRPLAPAAPLPESLFLDPFAEARPFRVIAPLAGRSAAVAVYNLTEAAQPVTGWIAPDDYAHAACMLQPPEDPWALPDEGLILYDTATGQATLLQGRYEFDLPDFGDRLLILVPIRHGWAAIGRTDKYLAPAAVEVIDATDDELIVRLSEPGPVTVWSQGPAPAADGIETNPVAENLWRLDVAEAMQAPIRIRR